MKLYVLSLVGFYAAKNATFPGMRDCLVSEGVIPSSIAGVGDSEYVKWNYQWNLRRPTLPRGYVRVESEADVQAAVKCGVRLGFPITVRGGGHSYEKLSMLDGRLVVDLSKLNSIQVNEETATIGAGALLGQVYAELWSQGKRSVPAGTCPSVGIAGHTLGGGYGLSSRKYGLMVDNVVSMRVVDARGRMLVVDKDSNSDLFFALRGAGMGSFGIVTQFTFQTFDASSLVNIVSMTYDYSRVTEVMDAWQKWAVSNPQDSITATFYISSSYGITINAVVQDDTSVAETVVQAFPSGFEQDEPITEKSYIDMIIQYGNSEVITDLASLAQTTPGSISQYYFKAKSVYISQPISKKGISNIARVIQGSPVDAYILLDLQGGAISHPPSNSAFIHRKNLYSIQYANYDSSVESGNQGDSFLNTLQAALQPYDSGFSYQNYIDLELAYPFQRYYGKALPKLIQIKKKHDPKNIFNNPLSIPLK
ncbi:hypothetical protein DSO57_1035990 [Entomophthora muscae]|uniref:Uncharacterized protein n=1 Tax=Entomophthora muscae TaxID=34485 RepID=A0ACC2TY49_9FUNG|nr:hypothetical protein DSO57_1035990 [Entomophthora muscae]